MRARLLAGAFAAFALAAGFPASGAATEGIGVPANVVSVTKETSVMTHAGFTTDYNGTASTTDDRVGTTRWRVVKDTGNCCELHLDASPGGRSSTSAAATSTTRTTAG